jgi:Co/Zn/Cd efflux system component
MWLLFVLHYARGETQLASFFISGFVSVFCLWFVMHTPSLKRFAWLSIAAAILTIGLKYAAYWLTGSVGLLSDALESLVNPAR